MTIKTFEEWYDGLPSYEHDDIKSQNKWMRFLAGRTFAQYVYDTGVKEASDHFEEEKVKIHEYYSKQLKSLLGEEFEFEIYEENNGKLE